MIEKIILFLALFFLSINIFNISLLTNHIVITPVGVTEIEDFPGFFKFMEFIVLSWRLVFSILVLLSLYKKTLNASVGFLIIGMASYTDNTLNHRIHEMGKAAFTLRVIILLLKVGLVIIGTYIIVNDLKKFNFKISTNKETTLIGLLDCSVFVIGIAYTLNSMFNTYPWEDFITDEDTIDFLESSVVEFYLHQLVEILLSSIGLVVTYFANFCPQDTKRVITNVYFRNLAIGVYTSASASYYAFLHTIAEGKDTIGVYAHVPIIYYAVIFFIISGIKRGWNDDIKHLLQHK